MLCMHNVMLHMHNVMLRMHNVMLCMHVVMLWQQTLMVFIMLILTQITPHTLLTLNLFMDRASEGQRSLHLAGWAYASRGDTVTTPTGYTPRARKLQHGGANSFLRGTLTSGQPNKITTNHSLC